MERSAIEEKSKLSADETSGNPDEGSIDEPRLFESLAAFMSTRKGRSTCQYGETYVIRRYRKSIPNLQVQTVTTIASSTTTTHLLPAILSAVVSGVKAASSSGVMKFDPPLKKTSLSATIRRVYQTIQLIVR